jgi:TonB family protein
VGYTLDYRHECEWNLAGNCRGAQRLAYAELTNSSAEFLACKLEIRARDFVTADARPLTREVLIGPGVTRRLLFADVSEPPGKQDLAANCSAVAKLAANAAAGKCRAKLDGTLDVENFYPQSAMRRGVEGSAVVRFWLPSGADTVVDAEIASSSGDPSLDEAALATLRSGKFSKECDYGLSTLRISFKLDN